MSEIPSSPDYSQLLAEAKERIRCAQYAALKAVNTELLGLYWDLGRMIVERQDRAGWGKSVVERLSGDLRREFPGIAGFSVQNLWYMRQFYMEYHCHEKLQPLVGEVAWTHNLVIMGKCKGCSAGNRWWRWRRHSTRNAPWDARPRAVEFVPCGS